MRTSRLLLLGALLIAVVLTDTLLSCSSLLSTKTGSRDTMQVVSCVGHALFWGDVSGSGYELPARGVWKIAADSSWAKLYIHIDTTHAHRITIPDDTLCLVRDSAWDSDNNDPHSAHVIVSGVDLTSDSVKIYTGYGFSGTNYLLKKT